MKLFLVLAIVALVGCAVEGRAIRDVKSDLIAKGTDLVKKADEAITKLEADKKTHEVTIIKTEEARIQKLIKDLEAATDDAKVKLLEHELTVAEGRLTHELARVNHTPVVVVPKPPVQLPVTRDLKDTLITRGTALLKEADEAIVKLEAAHHVHEAALIKTEEAHIKKLIADLTAATETTAITHLERELGLAEARLRLEVSRAGHTPVLPRDPIVTIPEVPKTPVTRDLKDTLITRGNDLVKKAEEAVTKLEADKKTHEATVVKAEEAHIKKLIADLTAATETAQIAHLERELGALEARLAHELNRINHTGPAPVVPNNPVTRDVKSDLIAKGNDLVKKADEAIKTLEAAKKTHEVTVVKAEEARIQKLITDLTAATETAQITHLERELGALEARLAHELNRINHTGPAPVVPSNPVVNTRDLKDTLITRGNDLVKRAEEAITKLETEHKTHEASIVKAEETGIKKLIADLTAATDATQIAHLERELAHLESRLANELTRINHPIVRIPHVPEGPVGPVVTIPEVPKTPVTRDLKDTLITRGNDLVKKAEEAVTKLEADKKTHEATVVKAEEAHIKKLIADLTASTETAQIAHLERELGALEARLAHELNRINHTGPAPVVPNPVTRDVKSDLIAKGNDLVKKATEAVTKLEADKKTHEATVVKAEEARIQKLITDLTAATETAQIAHLERELGALEARLAHELNRINHTGPVPVVPSNPVVTRDAKSDLIAKGNDLIKKATEAITKLEADKKTHEATVVKTEEAHIQKLITDLTAATDEAKIRTLEHELIQAEFRLQHELARVNHTPVVPANPANPTNP